MMRAHEAVRRLTRARRRDPPRARTRRVPPAPAPARERLPRRPQGPAPASRTRRAGDTQARPARARTAVRNSASRPLSVTRKPSRHQRGYGAAHQARRRNLEPYVRSGLAICTRCGQPIQPGDKWHLDHLDDRAGHLGARPRLLQPRLPAAKTNAIKARKRGPAPLRWSREWYVPDPGTIVDYGGGRVVEYRGSFAAGDRSAPLGFFAVRLLSGRPRTGRCPCLGWR